MNNENRRLCWITVKKDHHMSRLNDDGTRKALQFTDDGNRLDGPVELSDVDIEELKKELLSGNCPSAKQWLLTNILTPVISKILYIGVDRFCQWLATDGMILAKKGAKTALDTVKFYGSAFKAALAGDEIKATQLLKEVDAGNAIILTEANVESFNENNQQPSSVLAVEDAAQVMDLLRRSVLTTAACIKILTNTLITDDGRNPELILNAKKQLKDLCTQEVKNQITLILDDKNKPLLDESSHRILSAFRCERLLVNGDEIPISRYLTYEDDGGEI